MRRRTGDHSGDLHRLRAASPRKAGGTDLIEFESVKATVNEGAEILLIGVSLWLSIVVAMFQEERGKWKSDPK